MGGGSTKGLGWVTQYLHFAKDLPLFAPPVLWHKKSICICNHCAFLCDHSLALLPSMGSRIIRDVQPRRRGGFLGCLCPVDHKAAFERCAYTQLGIAWGVVISHWVRKVDFNLQKIEESLSSTLVTGVDSGKRTKGELTRLPDIFLYCWFKTKMDAWIIKKRVKFFKWKYGMITTNF